MQAPEYGEHHNSQAQDEEFVLAHARDDVEAAGFVSHLKLPHCRFPGRTGAAQTYQQEQNHG
ncbi:carbon-phosphorus lyase complex subunit PhnI [Escherichia coli]